MRLFLVLALLPLCGIFSLVQAQPFYGCSENPENATVFVPASVQSAIGQQNEPLEAGDEFRLVTDRGLCVGRGTWAEDGIQLAASGTIRSGDIGYEPGESIKMVVWDASAEKKYSAEYLAFGSCDSPLPCSEEGKYMPDGILTVTNIRATTPVGDFVHFQAVESDGLVMLQWSTKEDSSVARVEVEYQAEKASRWKTWSRVESHGKSGKEEVQIPTQKLPTGRYRFRLKFVNKRGEQSFSPVRTLQVALPDSPTVTAPHPNPSARCVQFAVAVPDEEQVRVRVYNALGQLVQKLFSGALAAGKKRTFRVCKKTLASGLYFVRVQGDSFDATRRFVLLR